MAKYPSKKGSTFAHCSYCRCDFTIGHGGSFDVKRHLASSKPQEMLKASSGSKELKSFFQTSSIEEKVTRAEILCASFIVEHNLPFTIADHFSVLHQ